VFDGHCCGYAVDLAVGAQLLEAEGLSGPLRV
jgi:hypothetical protein